MPSGSSRKSTSGLHFLVNVGLDYLTLNRSAGSLSGGEAQRIRLATQVGSRLVGVLYVLDEPSIGLHPRDNNRLLKTLEGLRDLGNTVLVVEHDDETIRTADWIIDLGPAAGEHGGRIIAEGDPEAILAHPKSLTGAYLSGRKRVPVPKKRRTGNGKALKIVGARANNLKDMDVNIPLGKLVCITGVSGSGKSTLMSDVLYNALAAKLMGSHTNPGEHERIEGVEHLDKIINIDQSPIGRTPRSNPGTYTSLFDEMRKLFAELPESKVRGYKPGRFSFNVHGGRCEACQGQGQLRIEMQFLPDVYVPCDVCHGSRFNRETLQVRFKGHSIADVLDMTVEHALEEFSAFPTMMNKLQLLDEVGLGYIRIGQPAPTLSGGEAQRVKLAKELSKRATGRTLYVLDEPSVGLHAADVHKLIEVLQRLVDAGNSVLIIEHNLDIIKTADWIIDLGPEGGDRGGEVVAEGTPEDLCSAKGSYTGEFLCAHLKPLSSVLITRNFGGFLNSATSGRMGSYGRRVDAIHARHILQKKEKNMDNKDSKKSTRSVIDKYRKRRQQNRVVFVWGGAALLILIGIILLVVWLSGPSQPLNTLFATETPTPTLTFTPTLTSTPTETVTITPTLTETLTPTQSAPYIYIVQEGDYLATIVEKENLGDDGVALILLLNQYNADTGDRHRSRYPAHLSRAGNPAPISRYASPNLYTNPGRPARGTKLTYTFRLAIRWLALQPCSTARWMRSSAENIDDPNAIFVGQQLTIPANIVTATATRPPTSTPLTPAASTSVPTATP